MRSVRTVLAGAALAATTLLAAPAALAEDSDESRPVLSWEEKQAKAATPEGQQTWAEKQARAAAGEEPAASRAAEAAAAEEEDAAGETGQNVVEDAVEDAVGTAEGAVEEAVEDIGEEAAPRVEHRAPTGGVHAGGGGTAQLGTEPGAAAFVLLGGAVTAGAVVLHRRRSGLGAH
ncbi:hypothetical protein AB0D08_07290 [Kitasatospora sp. NPDC048540]|uniref:hypothetical protein n=1 Tax=unclassified Kitasatospora TaxID=2633591 RepID=UPI00053B5B41|nr:hypothetical protein [Kitasatospora sp. MBT63]